MIANKKGKFISTTEIVQFAIDRISIIRDVSDIKDIWDDRVIEITEERHNLMRDACMLAYLSTHMIVGQDNHFFNFRESDNIHGEFSVDFIPKISSQILKEALGEKIEKRMANWRVQVFMEGPFARREAYKKHLAIMKILITKFGEPIGENSEKEWALKIREAVGDCDLWDFALGERQYCVTLRTLTQSEIHLHSVSFSISEFIQLKTI